MRKSQDRQLENVSEVGEAFLRYLSGRRIKITRARLKVLQAVESLTGHFEAEQVLYLLRERGERIAKATVYRTLPLLVSAGVLKQVRFDVKHAHYERAFGEEPHDHMVCRRCGRIREFGSGEVTRLRTRLARRYQFHAISHRFQIVGLCADCARACPVAAVSPTQPPAS